MGRRVWGQFSAGACLCGMLLVSATGPGAAASASGPVEPAPDLGVAAASVQSGVVGGGVFSLGGAPALGSLAGDRLNQPVVGMAATPDGRGYWLVASDGGVFGFGDARFYGSTGAIRLNEPVVGMAATPDGRGYWLVASDGGVFGFGDARFYGSTGAIRLNEPVVGMAATPDGRGYWLVASDGGVFGFGDARFYGSTGAIHLNEPVVGMAAGPAGRGYWLVGSDGGVYAFGDAAFHGSAGALRLHAPVAGMAATPDGRGYWLVGTDGGVFTYGDAPYQGSVAGRTLAQPVIGIVADPKGGYWLYEGNRSGAPADVFGPGLVDTLDQRSGVVSAAVLDLNTGDLYQYRPGQQDIDASIVKVQILGTLMAQAQAAGRNLTAAEQSLATQMIEDSDNSAATSLWNEVGGAPAVQNFDDSVGMHDTTPEPAWGLTITTAADQISLLQNVVLPSPVLASGSQAYMLQLMESVTPDQAWGVSAGTAPGATVALKNGWLQVSNGWEVNSIGWVHGSGRNYLIAVLTSGDPDESYGIDSIGLVSDAAWNSLYEP